MSAAMPLLRLEHINKSFGTIQALTDISLDLPAGQVTALTGDNGAGKSVLVKCIAGIRSPDSGARSGKGNRFAPAPLRMHLHWESRLFIKTWRYATTSTSP